MPLTESSAPGVLPRDIPRCTGNRGITDASFRVLAALDGRRSSGEGQSSVGEAHLLMVDMNLNLHLSY